MAGNVINGNIRTRLGWAFAACRLNRSDVKSRGVWNLIGALESHDKFRARHFWIAAAARRAEAVDSGVAGTRVGRGVHAVLSCHREPRDADVHSAVIRGSTRGAPQEGPYSRSRGGLT